jgi:phosphoribosylformylglycinamidine synthase II
MKGKENIAFDIFKKWDLHCVQIGEVINDTNIKITYHGKPEVDVPAYPLVLGGGAPVYERESKEPAYLKDLKNLDYVSLHEPEDLNEILLRLISSPNIANKNWVYEQYDTQVRTNTVVLPGGDASVVRIKGTNKALAMKTDCNGRYVYLNPYKGGLIAVCESARNVVCTGAEPLAITNCLNFGNPYKPEVYYQFKEAIRGIGDACRALNTPVTGGNVSFYNESPDYAVYPTPVIGMIGLIEDVKNVTTSYFKEEDNVIAVVGGLPFNKNDKDGLGGSEYLKQVHNTIAGGVPDIDPAFEMKLYKGILEMINKGLIKSAHDISDGGFAVAIAECCMMNRKKSVGCKIDFEYNGRKDFALFNESQSRIIVSVKKENIPACEKICSQIGVSFSAVGITGGNKLIINKDINLNLEILRDAYYNSIQIIMETNKIQIT